MITIPIWVYVLSCLMGLPIFCIVITNLVNVFKIVIEIVKTIIEEIKLL